MNLHFARDLMGNINAEGNTPGASPATESYGYDPLYRLTSVTDGTTPLQGFTYNQTGDRTSKTGSGLATGTYGYQANTHWLTSIGSAARSYDANGNTTGNSSAGQTWGYGYNGRNRMTVVQAGGSTVGTYIYNAMGQRIAKTATVPQAVSERYNYAGSQLIGEYGTTNRDYIWLGDIPVATVDTTGSTSTVNYIVADYLGTPRAVTDSSGTTIWSWPYVGNTFGEMASNSITGYTLNLRFPGQYFDAESGLINNGFRIYDSSIGGYLQVDPTGFNGGISLYAYAGRNPQNYSDRLGLNPSIGVLQGGVGLGEGEAIASNPVGWLTGAAVGGYWAGSQIYSAYDIDITDWVWNETHPAVSRPMGLTKLEKRHFDRTCKDSSDPCESLKISVRTAITQARVKMMNMQNDKVLFKYARSVPNPDVTGNSTTWNGHVDDLNGRLANISAMISLGNKLGCDMSQEAAAAATLLTPMAPGN